MDNRLKEFKNRISNVVNSSEMSSLMFEVYGDNISRKDVRQASRVMKARVEEIVKSPTYRPNF